MNIVKMTPEKLLIIMSNIIKSTFLLSEHRRIIPRILQDNSDDAILLERMSAQWSLLGAYNSYRYLAIYGGEYSEQL